MTKAIQIFEFLSKHASLVELLMNAVSGGVQHEHLITAIKREMTLASDAIARAELK